MQHLGGGPNLGLLFNTHHMCDMFFIIEEYDIAGHADNSTPYFGGETTKINGKFSSVLLYQANERYS